MNTNAVLALVATLFIILGQSSYAKELAQIDVTIIEKVTVESTSLGNKRSNTIITQMRKSGEFQRDEITKEKDEKTEVQIVRVDISKATCKTYEIGNALKAKGLRFATSGETFSVDSTTHKESQENKIFVLGSVLRFAKEDGTEDFLIFAFNTGAKEDSGMEINFFLISGEWEGTIYVSAVPIKKPEDKK